MAWYKEQNNEIEKVLSKEYDESKQIDEIARIRKWFGSKTNSSSQPVLQEYLDGKLDLSQATQKLFSPLDEVIKSNDQISGFLEFWYSIIHTSKRISFRNEEGHTKLVELVRAFKNRPCPPNKWGNTIYSTLLDFNMASRESYNDSPGVGAGYFVPEIHAWANLNYFFARLTAEDLDDISLFAIWAMREALEKVHKDDDPEEDMKPATAKMKYDANTPAAAVWVFAMGKSLYDLEKDLTPTNRNQGSPARGGELWTGKPEFSKERWALWKKRFGEISGMEELSQETKDVAREAAEAMEKAEQS